MKAEYAKFKRKKKITKSEWLHTSIFGAILFPKNREGKFNKTQL